MKCVFCCGRVQKRMVTFSYKEEDKHLLVEHVPAEVCDKCGEKTYSPEVVEELLRFTKDKAKPVKVIEVPVFDFAGI